MSIPTHHLKRTVLIGLGGTGKEALLHAKRKYIETFGEVPPLVSFLVIDTTNDNATTVPAVTPNGTVEDIKLNANELLHIVARGASALPKVNDEVREWWPPKASLKSNILSGAGQVRALGRLALFANAKLVYDTLRNKLADARDYSKVRTPEGARAVYESMSPHLTVCVTGSIAGGTGSGTFIDVALLLRDLLKDEDQLFGYLVLPDIFTPNPGTQNVEANAYGALKELDHLMTRDDTWSYPFGGRRINVTKKPFDMAFLINRQNRAGKTFNNKENLSELIGMGMFLAGGPLGKEQADIFDNIVVQLTEGQGKFYGKTAHYASFGAAEMRFETGDLDLQRAVLTAQQASTWLDDRARPWPFDLTGHTLLAGVTPEEVPIRLEGASSVEQEAGRWASLTEDLDTLVNQVRDEQCREWMRRVDDLQSDLDSALARGFQEGHTLYDLTDGLQQLREQVEAKVAHARESTQEAQEKFGSNKDKTQRSIQENSTLKRSRGLFRREPELDLVLTRRKLEVLKSDAVACGVAQAQAETLERMAARLSATHTRLLNLRGKLSSWFEQHRTNVQASSVRRKQGAQPFTLAVPPAYVPGPQVPVTREFQAGERLRTLGLSALLGEDYTTALSRAFAVVQASNLRDWLSAAAQQSHGETQRREVERAFRELDEISAPCWDYQDAWVSNPAVGHLEQLNILGIEDKRDATHPVFSSTVQDVFAGHLHKFQHVSTRDPGRIILYKIEAAIPAFALAGAQTYREKYETLSANGSYHIHRDWEHLPDLAPLPDAEAAMELWVKARITGCLRATDSGIYQYLSDREGVPRWYDLQRAAPAAFAHLGRDFFLYKELERQAEGRWNNLAEDQLLLNLEHFSEKSEQLQGDAQRDEDARRFFAQQTQAARTLERQVRDGQAFEIADDFEPVFP
ncbi:tubulin-like doman-containing protein [Deinococcus aerophilus]|uniref:Tubulin-like protein n=1 Tax=Deinococcus aerophilus TaxID=522488 RepID=A0ABQ2GX85_9DEIO|nr:tubulin-like doman-containing protein [Deinococcus aerophilus]GGM16643.1 hypothetical protein GCM10010841_26200 [Deinococcus aerophilus]